MNNLTMKIEEIAKEKGFYVTMDGRLFKNDIEISRKIDNSGYAFHPIYLGFKEGKRIRKQLRVHRFQAFQKFGYALYEKGVVTRHLNGNKLDNSFNNIDIGSNHDNIMDIPAHIRRERAISASLKNQKRYQKDFVESVKRDRANGLSYRALMEKYGITSKGTISFMCSNNYSWDTDEE